MVNNEARRVNDINQYEEKKYSNNLMNRDKQSKLKRQQIVINTNHCRTELDTI